MPFLCTLPTNRNVLYKLFHAHRNMTTKRIFFFRRRRCRSIFCVTNAYRIWPSCSRPPFFQQLSSFTRCYGSFAWSRSLFFLPLSRQTFSGSWQLTIQLYCININYEEQSVLMLQLISSMNITSISLVLCMFFSLVFFLLCMYLPLYFPSHRCRCSFSNMSICMYVSFVQYLFVVDIVVFEWNKNHQFPIRHGKNAAFVNS